MVEVATAKASRRKCYATVDQHGRRCRVRRKQKKTFTWRFVERVCCASCRVWSIVMATAGSHSSGFAKPTRTRVHVSRHILI